MIKQNIGAFEDAKYINCHSRGFTSSGRGIRYSFQLAIIGRRINHTRQEVSFQEKIIIDAYKIFCYDDDDYFCCILCRIQPPQKRVLAWNHGFAQM